MPRGEEDSTQAHLEHWFDCIRNRTNPEENVEVGHRACAVAHMVNMSIESGGSVYWDFGRQTVKRW